MTGKKLTTSTSAASDVTIAQILIKPSHSYHSKKKFSLFQLK
jgi:hypothetical protein